MQIGKNAVIDVGSNSIRLLLCNENKFVSKETKITRLAENLVNTGELLPQAIERTSNAILSFYDKAKKYGCENIYVLATESVRISKNRDTFVDLLKNNGINLTILSPEEEAYFGFKGATTGIGTEGVLDIGGASTELTIGQNNKILFTKSLHIGIVKLKDMFQEDIDAIKNYLDLELLPFKKAHHFNKLYTIGGAGASFASIINKMEVFSNEKVNNTIITKDEILKTTIHISHIPINERSIIVGLPMDRYDVVVPSGVLLASILEVTGKEKVIIKDQDGMQGFLEDKFNCKISY